MVVSPQPLPRPTVSPPPASSSSSSELSLEQPAGSALIRSFESVQNQEDLDRLVAQLVTECAALNKVRPPSSAPVTRRAPPDIASLPPQAVQRFYGRNRKRSFEQITGHKSPTLEIPINILGDSLNASMGTHHHHSAQEILVKGDDQDNITGEPVDPAEVVLRLAKAANSAPSPLDRLTYQHIKRFDAEGKVLAALFSACLRTGLTPAQWRKYVTVLIYKRPKEPSPEEAANPKNWRPIALLPTISKVLTGILADRLSEWASRVAAISPSQKGCYAGEGCFEHLQVLSTLRDFASPSKPVHVAFLDLADAFTSVPHDLILDTLRARGVSDKCINILHSLYTNTSTSVTNARGDRTTVGIQSGVRQGCPASPILFALAVEPLLRTPFPPGSGFKVGAEEVHILAYADDLALVASSPQALQEKLTQVSARASLLGLRFNPAKCATLSWGPRNSASIAAIDGIPIKSIEDRDFYKYLGTPVGLSSWQPSPTVIRTFQSELQAIQLSALRPWQKLDAIRTFIFPRLSYHLRASTFPAYLVDRKKGGVDRWTSRAVKRILHLPATASEAYLHTPTHLGGVGLPCARDEQAVLKAAHFLRMATSPDPTVRALTFESLRRLVSQRCLVGAPTIDQLAAFLNGQLPVLQDGRGSIWTPLLTALSFLRRRAGVQVLARGESFALSIPSGPQDEEPCCIGEEQRQVIIRALHEVMGRRHYDDWKAQANQGKAASLYAAEPSGLDPFSRWSRMRFCDWHFLHRARLNLVPTNAVKAAFYADASPLCRVCGREAEYLGHVLGRCWHHSADLQRRHNAVQDAVVDAVRASISPSAEANAHTDVLVNSTPRSFASLERVDLQVVDRLQNKVTLIDFKCPFEAGGDAFTAARKRNEEKYKPLADRYRQLGFDVHLDTFVVGALGTWDPANHTALKRLGIPRSRTKALATTCCQAALHVSRNMWIAHVTGIRQT